MAGGGQWAPLDGFGGCDEVGTGAGTLLPASRVSSRPSAFPDFDRMRQHYVAFSRARNLLVLTAAAPPADHFAAIWDHLPRWPALDAAARNRLLSQRFGPAHSGNTRAPSANLVIHRVKRLIVRPGGAMPG